MPEDLISNYLPGEKESVILIKTGLSKFLQEFKSNRLSFPGLELGSPVIINVEDAYFDTPSKNLSNAQLALRLRKQGDVVVLGLKGRDRWTCSGVSRIEVEESWSANGLATILHYLEFLGVALTHPGVPIGSAEPASILGLMGMKTIQNRSLERTLWPLSDTANNKTCSLGLDIVTLNLSNNPVKFGEIEIELTNGPVNSIQNVFDTLIYNYPESLQPWQYSKLQTGAAIETLSKSSNCSIADENGELTPNGIKQIEQLLRQPH